MIPLQLDSFGSGVGAALASPDSHPANSPLLCPTLDSSNAYLSFGGVRGIITHWYVYPRGLSGRRNDSDVSHRPTPFTNPSESQYSATISLELSHRVFRGQRTEGYLSGYYLSRTAVPSSLSCTSQLQFLAEFLVPHRGALDCWRDSTSLQLLNSK